MAADLSELRGEVLALTCALAALLNVAPLASQASMWRRFEHLSGLVHDRMDDSGKAGFAHAVVRLQVRRPAAGKDHRELRKPLSG